MEEFELVLQSRYLNQSRISARCVEWDTEEEIWGITQAFKELTTYSKKKKILENKSCGKQPHATSCGEL